MSEVGSILQLKVNEDRVFKNNCPKMVLKLYESH